VSEESERTLFDSHCHLTAAAFAGEVEAVLARAREAGLAGIVTVASNADDAVAALQLAQAHPDVWSTAGIHPHDAAAARAGDLSRIRELCQEPRVVALGETGLDYHYDNSPRDVQRRLLDAHIDVAVETGLPLVLHSRSAEADTAAAVRAAATAGASGVLHCFSGSGALLDAALETGWYVSFAGLITFKRFEGADLLRAVPGDRLLIETDSPYLAPVPQRGRRNEPAFVAHTCAAAAALRGESPAELARSTMDNARRFLNLSGAVAPRP
jgi:TatD DNase family protein